MHQQSTEPRNHSEDGVHASLHSSCAVPNHEPVPRCPPSGCCSAEQAVCCCRRDSGVISSSSIEWKSLALRLSLFISVLYYVSYSLLNSSAYLRRLDDAERMYDELVQAQETVVQQLHEANQALLLEKKQLVEDLRMLEQNARDQVERLQRERDSVASVESALASRIQSNVHHAAKKAVLQEYGEGPHLVEVEVRTWEQGSPSTRFFSIELAPVDKMPLAVLMFLEHVRRDLWSQTSFQLNTEQAIVARPVSGDGLFRKEEMFDSCPFGSLPFEEYSEEFPHAPYTLAFSGLGPNFYINKRSNPTSRDPCFATVVLGRDTINLISSMSGTDEDPSKLKPVDIISLRLIAMEHLSEHARQEYLAVKQEIAHPR